MTKPFEFLPADPAVRFRQPMGEKRAIEPVGEPNLLRSMFPYHEVPKITFDSTPEVALDPAQERMRFPAALPSLAMNSTPRRRASTSMA